MQMTNEGVIQLLHQDVQEGMYKRLSPATAKELAHRICDLTPTLMVEEDPWAEDALEHLRQLVDRIYEATE